MGNLSVDYDGASSNVITPIQSEIEKMEDAAATITKLMGDLASYWSGTAFERVCLEHVPQIKATLGISGVYTEVNTWQCQADADAGIFGSQIDLLIDRRDHVVSICEMKYSVNKFGIDKGYDEDLRNKLERVVNSEYKEKVEKFYD